MNKFKDAMLNLDEKDSPLPKYTEGMKKFYSDPVATYKRSIASKEALIAKYERLIEKNKISIKWIKMLIETEESKK